MPNLYFPWVLTDAEAYPAESLDLEAFWNGGAEAVDFHDIPVVDRPCFVEMKQFIDNEGQSASPSIKLS